MGKMGRQWCYSTSSSNGNVQARAIPTDGSPLSRKAAKAGIAFAKQIGAKVTAYNATEVVPEYAAGGFILRSVLEQFEAGALKQAQKHLREVAKLARAAGIPCESKSSLKATVYQGIIDAAKRNKCDVIFMASHGRGDRGSWQRDTQSPRPLQDTRDGLPLILARNRPTPRGKLSGTRL
jgi:nucleotide-binding universal stress UspA family protein